MTQMAVDPRVRREGMPGLKGKNVLVTGGSSGIGQELGLIDAAGSAALIGAGLLSVLIFPLTGLLLLKREPRTAPAAGDDHEPALIAM